MKKVIIDLYGADKGPEELLRGAVQAAESNPSLNFVLVGDEASARAFLEKEGVSAPSFEFIQTTDYISNHEPAMAIFKGRDECSTAKALDALKADDEAIGLLGAGNTGALMVGSIFRLGLNGGLKSPALSTMLPNVKGGMTTLVDCGANVNIDAVNLVDFARLGSEFVRRMFDIKAPRVALLNVGREEGKGSPLYAEAYGLLKTAGENGEINFIGNAEGYDIITGYADVVVCDGFAGNIVLKLTEAVGKTALSLVEAKMQTGETTSAAPANGASEEQTALHEISENLKDLFVFNERGGATFLGTKKPVIKMHGCATADTVVACTEQLLKVSR